MQKDILVGILNYNGKHFLQNFLPSVIRNSPEADILVIDNQSLDGSVEFLKKNFPQVKTKVLEKNFGFAQGYNLGLTGENYKYLVLLNNDVEVTEGWLGPMYSYMEKNQQVAVLQPKLLQYYQKDTFEYSGACGGHLDMLGYPFCKGRIFYTMEKDTGQYNRIEKIFWACGAAMMIRTDVFRKLHGFDPLFFAHMEEIDLCWRIQQSGYEIHNFPPSIVFHVGGGTLKENSIKKIFLNIRNSLFCILKNYPGSSVVFILLFRMLLDGLGSFYFIFKGNPKILFTVVLAHLSFYRHLPYCISFRRKRKNIIPDFRPCFPDKNYSIVYKYFIAKKKKYHQLP